MATSASARSEFAVGHFRIFGKKTGNRWCCFAHTFNPG